jgi:hypothetical protein
MKKNTALKIMFLVMAILFLQVVKALISSSGWDYQFFTATVITAIQFLLLITFPVAALCRLFLRKKFASKSTVMSWSMAFALVILAECLFTWWLHNPSKAPGFLRESYRYFYFQHNYHVAQFEDALSNYDPRLFYVHKPGLKGSFTNAEFSHQVLANSKGMRDDDSSLHRPAIICIGDSYTWGWGVDQSHIWPELLQQQKGMKVLNAAMPSYGTARSVIRLSELDLSNLQYLVVQYCANDATENAEYIKQHYRLPISSEAEYRKLTRANRINLQYFPGKNFLLVTSIFLKKLVNKIVPVFKFESMYGDKEMVNEKTVNAFLQVLSKAPVDFAKVKIVAFQLDPLPLVTDQFARLTDSLVHTAAYDAVFQNNLQVIDMSRIVKQEDYYVLDPHLIPSSQTKIAQAVGRLITQ